MFMVQKILRNGQRYGFVRFKIIMSIEDLLRRLQNIRVGSELLRVYLAYDRRGLKGGRGYGNTAWKSGRGYGNTSCEGGIKGTLGDTMMWCVGKQMMAKRNVVKAARIRSRTYAGCWNSAMRTSRRSCLPGAVDSNSRVGDSRSGVG
ncbi:hypothetical protein Tco_0475714 [Tanacetum coccineum]